MISPTLSHTPYVPYSVRVPFVKKSFISFIPQKDPFFNVGLIFSVKNHRVNWVTNAFHSDGSCFDKNLKQMDRLSFKNITRYFMKNLRQIEVEKKVKLELHHLKKIESEGTFIEEVRFKDTYFDTADCSLTSQNMWLRQREKQFELKIGIKSTNNFSDRYEEVKDEQKILAHLGLIPNPSEDLLNTLSRAGISPFASFITQRKRYQLEELAVDVDIADFGDLTYRVAEFEIMVSSVDHVAEAEDKIKTILQKMQIDMSTTVPAKLTYYMYNRRHNHYKILVANRVIKPMHADES